MLYEPTCEVCEHTGDNGAWVEEVIKDKDDKSSK